MKNQISVTIKLFSGIDKELNLRNYDQAKGIRIALDSNKRLRSILKEIGLKKLSSYIYFLQGERISRWKMIKDGDEISCLKPSGGG